ncbi:hypothetical protein KUTeg_000329 [Tegillarca granosa]|uniref:Uncharacterized protein n=1 Tax=Tegillarca granosa TaxID=220873 RepID=A0ABQ9FX92_TEGGR|nr:hypothetical protein KUTeg_000329 [Tegillarca granosa]
MTSKRPTLKERALEKIGLGTNVLRILVSLESQFLQSRKILKLPRRSLFSTFGNKLNRVTVYIIVVRNDKKFVGYEFCLEVVVQASLTVCSCLSEKAALSVKWSIAALYESHVLLQPRIPENKLELSQMSTNNGMQDTLKCNNIDKSQLVKNLNKKFDKHVKKSHSHTIWYSGSVEPNKKEIDFEKVDNPQKDESKQDVTDSRTEKSSSWVTVTTDNGSGITVSNQEKKKKHPLCCQKRQNCCFNAEIQKNLKFK